MKQDAFWEWFYDTGEPVCWLLYRLEGRSLDAASAARDDSGPLF